MAQDSVGVGSMFNSCVLDVAVGLIFAFLALSLVVSSVVESIASILKLRSRSLLQAVMHLLNDDQFSGLARSLYNHALIDPCDPGTATQRGHLKRPPGYIDPDHFAQALTDVIGVTAYHNDLASIKEKINGKVGVAGTVTNPQLNQLINGIVERAGGDLDRVRQQLAGWFDASMDRVSGAYKRVTQLVGFLIELAIAVFFNVSAVNIGQILWQEPMLARGIGAQTDFAKVDFKSEIRKLNDLNMIGWRSHQLEYMRDVVTLKGRIDQAHLATGGYLLLGWLISAVATLFGAPFWFDALQRIVRLKGRRPQSSRKTLEQRRRRLTCGSACEKSAPIVRPSAPGQPPACSAETFG